MRNTPRSRSLPKLSAMAAVKYAPPAMPPMKKYQTMRRCQSGVLTISIAALLSAAVAEGDDRPPPDEQRGAHRQERVHEDVALGQERLFGEVVGGRRVQEQEEGIEPAERAVAVGAVELGARVPHFLALREALLGLGHQLVAESELDGLGGARLGAGGPQPVVDAVIAEGALVGPAGVVVVGHHPERARADAVPAPFADILIDVDGAELGPVDGAGGAGVEAAGLGAVLADIGHEEPLELAVGLGLLDEPHQAVGLVGEVGLVLVPSRPLRLLQRQL